MNRRAPRRLEAICPRHTERRSAITHQKHPDGKHLLHHDPDSAALHLQTGPAFASVAGWSKVKRHNLRQELLSDKNHPTTADVPPDLRLQESVVSALSLRIRKARSAAGLTQAELARRVGVKRSAVTQWEHPSGTRPSVDHLIEIAMQTDTMFEWLATGRGPSVSADPDAAPAVMIEEYARDAEESLALGQLRLLSPMKRKIALDILTSMAR
jgi:transcriptional regulator with XRE-family HTH domain